MNKNNTQGLKKKEVIYKHRLSLNADSQSCLRFACFPQEHQWKIFWYVSWQTKKNWEKKKKREGLKPVRQFPRKP